MTKCPKCKAALEAKDAQCRHRIADARNPIVRSGYLCVDCGALFSAADHEMPKQEKKVEPVAVVSGYYGGQCVVFPTDPARLFNSGTALYTTPPQRIWVGLTAEEREQVQAESYGKVPHHVALIAAIEAKLKEKNETN